MDIIDKQGKLTPPEFSPADSIRSGGVDTICPDVLGMGTKIRHDQKPIQEDGVVPGSNNPQTPVSAHDDEQCVRAMSKNLVQEADNDHLDEDGPRNCAEWCMPDQPGG